MWIIGCDYHAGFEYIAFVNQATGDCGSKRLEHGNGEAEQVVQQKQKQHQNQKQNPLGKRKPVSSLSRPRVPQNRLDTADFLIDGLLSSAPAGASIA
jgi:hypothetical protein